MTKAREPFVMTYRSVLESLAWQRLGLQARRFIDFLMLEHLRHGGKRNGSLLAPHRQLVAYGIHPGAVAPAIREAVSAGFVDMVHGTGRAPNRYTLTWLDMADGIEASHRWQHVAVAPEKARGRGTIRRRPGDPADAPARPPAP